MEFHIVLKMHDVCPFLPHLHIQVDYPLTSPMLELYIYKGAQLSPLLLLIWSHTGILIFPLNLLISNILCNLLTVSLFIIFSHCRCVSSECHFFYVHHHIMSPFTNPGTCTGLTLSTCHTGTNLGPPPGPHPDITSESWLHFQGVPCLCWHLQHHHICWKPGTKCESCFHWKQHSSKLLSCPGSSSQHPVRSLHHPQVAWTTSKSEGIHSVLILFLDNDSVRSCFLCLDLILLSLFSSLFLFFSLPVKLCHL